MPLRTAFNKGKNFTKAGIISAFGSCERKITSRKTIAETVKINRRYIFSFFSSALKYEGLLFFFNIFIHQHFYLIIELFYIRFIKAIIKATDPFFLVN